MALYRLEAFREYSTRTTEFDVLNKWFDSNVANQKDLQSMLYLGFQSERDLISVFKIKSLTHLTILGVESLCLDGTELLISEKLSVEVKNVLFEEFVPSKKYDLILFSHVLYYIRDRTVALKKAMSILSNKGRLLIFHRTEHGIYRLQKLFNHNTYTYCLNVLQQDLNTVNLCSDTIIVDSMVRIDTPTRKLCDFIVEKETSEEEFHQLFVYLNGLGRILYQPSAIIVIHQALNESDINPIETLSRKLLKGSDEVLLSFNELLEVGTRRIANFRSYRHRSSLRFVCHNHIRSRSSSDQR